MHSRRIQNQKHRRTGFTLVEILIVLAIVGVIAAMALPRLIGTQQDALKRQSAIAVQDLAKSVDLWAIRNNGNYPTSLQELMQKGADGAPALYDKVPLDGFGTPLNYEYPNTKASTDAPAIWSNGQNRTNENGGGDDINNWSNIVTN